MEFVAALPFLIPIVAIIAGVYYEVTKIKAEAATQLGRATDHLDDELAEAQAERDRLRQRIEALEAIVTSEGYDLEREARAAGVVPAGRIDPGLLDATAPPPTEPAPAPRRRTR